MGQSGRATWRRWPQKMLEAAGKENFSDKVRGAPSEPPFIHVSQDLSEKELAEGL